MSGPDCRLSRTSSENQPAEGIIRRGAYIWGSLGLGSIFYSAILRADAAELSPGAPLLRGSSVGSGRQGLPKVSHSFILGDEPAMQIVRNG